MVPAASLILTECLAQRGLTCRAHQPAIASTSGRMHSPDTTPVFYRGSHRRFNYNSSHDGISGHSRWRRELSWRSVSGATHFLAPLLFGLVGLAGLILWHSGGLQQQQGQEDSVRQPGLKLYGAGLLVNMVVWPPVLLLGQQRAHSACLAASCVLLLMLAAMFVKFYEVAPLAGLLLLPAFAWSCFGITLINLCRWSNNAQVLQQVQEMLAFKLFFRRAAQDAAGTPHLDHHSSQLPRRRSSRTRVAPPDAGHIVISRASLSSCSPVCSLLSRISASLHQVLPLPLDLEDSSDSSDAGSFLDDCHLSTDTKYWSCPGSDNFKVRGPTYLKDKKKVAVDGCEFALVSMDLVEVGRPAWHIAQHLPSITNSTAPFTFILNVLVPGKPQYSLVSSWATGYDPWSEEPTTPFERILRRFLESDEKQRHGIFKLIPRIEKGSWIVKHAVGQNTPVLLGRKLTTKYFQGPRYIEVDVDVASSHTACHVVGLVQGTVKSLIIDMAVLLQGDKEEELPESLLGTVRLHHLDLSAAPLLDLDANTIMPKLEKAGSPQKAQMQKCKSVPTSPAKMGHRSSSTPKLCDVD